MLYDVAEKSSIKMVLKWVFSGFSIYFISMNFNISSLWNDRCTFGNISRILYKIWIFSIS